MGYHFKFRIKQHQNQLLEAIFIESKYFSYFFKIYYLYLIMPQFDYYSHVWSNCSITLSNGLQVLLNNLARIIVSADIRTHIDSMMTTLKLLKLHCRLNNHILILLFKCLTGKAPDYLFQIYFYSFYP